MKYLSVVTDHMNEKKCDSKSNISEIKIYLKLKKEENAKRKNITASA